MMNKKYGSVAIKKISPVLAEIPEDCGYEKKFKFNIDMNSNGIMADCIEWCQINYMSFERKRDATRFWISVGVQNSVTNRDN